MSENRRFDLINRSQADIDGEVEEELRFELDMRTAELVQGGLSEPEARRQAMSEFGDLEGTRLYCSQLDHVAERSRRRTEWLAELRQDVRLAWRGMRRSPGFAFVVLITLALGIGANTAVFSVVREVLLDQLPYHEPDRLVRLYGGRPGVPDARGMLTPAEVTAVAESPAFATVGAFGYYGGLTYVGEQSSEMWGGVRVGPNYFGTLGVRAALGRTIDARDVEPGAGPVVVLGYELWQRAFAGDSRIIGTQVLLNDRMRRVIGVMPSSFVSPDRNPEAWTPLDLPALLREPGVAPTSRMFRAVGRVADGVTPAGLRSALVVSTRRVEAGYPALGDVAPPNAVPLRDDMVGDVRPILLVVMGAAGLVLLLCCVNVSGLFLARATSHRRELAIRAAVGAGRGRLVRQVLTESAVVAVIGGAIGIGFAFWSKGTLVEAATLLVPSVRDVPLDAGVLGFAVIVSLSSAVLFGLVPARVATRTDLHDALAESSRGSAGGRLATRANRVLVVAQVALAVVLLIGAGLLGRTLYELERTGVGFETGPDQLTFRVNLSSDEYEDPARRTAFLSTLTERLRSLPGVRAAGLVGVSPWNGYTAAGPDSLMVENAGSPMEVVGLAARVTVSEGYFDALGIPLRRGRTFTTSDDEGAASVAVMNEALAQRLWPRTNPLGRIIRIGGESAPPRTIVGVVGDVRAAPASDVRATVYVPAAQNALGGAEFIVRTAGDALALVPAIRRELHQLDPRLPAVRPRTLEQVVDDMLAGFRLPLLFTGLFAALALLLATLGVYSVLAYSVTERQREFGIRAALGARRAAVLALVLRQGLMLAFAGIATGMLLAAVATPVLERLLVGVTPHDLITFSAVPVILLAVSLAACLVPARRSTRIQPIEALRVE